MKVAGLVRRQLSTSGLARRRFSTSAPIPVIRLPAILFHLTRSRSRCARRIWTPDRDCD